MTRINKFANMFYEIDGDKVCLEVVERCEGNPDVHISKTFSATYSNFWDFVLDAVIESRQVCLDIISNEDGDSTPEGIEAATKRTEALRGIETALYPLISDESRKKQSATKE